MDPVAAPEIIHEGPAWAIVDGHYAMAMVTSCLAMDIAITKAKSSGIGYVGVKNSNHFGAAGYYPNMAVKKDMIGLSMTNTNPLVAVPGGKTAVLGTNPFSYAVPAGQEKPIFLDIATSVVAASKVITAKAVGKKIPDNWLVDGDGVPTTDPGNYPNVGALLPMAGHKGYGLSLMIEILSAVLTGADLMSDVKLWLEDHLGPLNQGHAFIAIDVGAIIPIDQFKARMDRLIREIRESPKAKGSVRIYLPGEMEWEKREQAMEKGMQLPEDAIDRLIGLAEDIGLDMGLFF
jgi:LDH2 family malate/lactate/ureidoglycolate dehydrogenase